MTSISPVAFNFSIANQVLDTFLELVSLFLLDFFSFDFSVSVDNAFDFTYKKTKKCSVRHNFIFLQADIMATWHQINVNYQAFNIFYSYINHFEIAFV